MDDVITLSSDTDKDEDSDVEVIGSFSRFKDDPLPLSTVRLEVEALNINIPSRFTDLKDTTRVVSKQNTPPKINSTASAVGDLTESALTNGSERENVSPNDCQIRNESINEFLILTRQDSSLQKISGKDFEVVAPVQDCGIKKPKQRHLDSQTQLLKQTKNALSHHRTPVLKLKRMPFLENYVRKLKNMHSVCVSEKLNTIFFLKQLQNQGLIECTNGLNYQPTVESPVLIGPLTEKEQENSSNSLDTQLYDQVPLNQQMSSSCLGNGGSGAASKEHSTQDNHVMDSSSTFISSQAPSALAHDKAQYLPQIEVHSTNISPTSMTEQLEWNETESRHSHLSGHSSIHEHNPPLSINLSSPSHTSPISHKGTASPTTSENFLELDELKLNGASDHGPISEIKTVDMDEGSENGSYKGDIKVERPVSIDRDDDDGEGDVYLGSKLECDFRGATGGDRNYVCPKTVKRIRIGIPQFQINEEEKRTPEELCRRSLSLVYSTIDEKYPEGTLQILSDLFQPGYYPPKDITSHLLHDILLDTHCPHHLCVEAFNLLMRTQRHHFTDKSMIPWDWELLTSVMASQDPTKTYRWEVVRMLLEYVLQTLEDDFKAKRATLALYHSIAKNTLSCDQRFPQVRDIIKWLFSAIVKSTEKSTTAAEERDEQMKMVCIFQRMLFLALEVDCCPAFNSAKLSQELFHMLISDVPLRAHRMLLLESLQSKLLRCKLLEHLLDYSCPVKIPLPMSLSLLLHFLKNCTLTPDPTDGDERWQRWEELVHLLWMLLLSYNGAMKGYLSSSIIGQRSRGGTLVFRPDDRVSKSAVCEAVETFLSRSQEDLGKALPQHIGESLTYLQDHLLSVCQS